MGLLLHERGRCASICHRPIDYFFFDRSHELLVALRRVSVPVVQRMRRVASYAVILLLASLRPQVSGSATYLCRRSVGGLEEVAVGKNSCVPVRRKSSAALKK